MEMNLEGFDLQTLKTMHQKEDAILKAALLEGKSWDEVFDQRYTVTQLAIAIHKKEKPSVEFNPAEFVKPENYTDLVP
jgi:hypothetical protein